jgi:tetratricopeptide (TPR) repeat protein
MTANGVMGEIQVLMQAGHRYHEQGNHKQSLEQYRKAIALATPLGDAELMAILFWHTGIAYRDCDNYHHAAELVGAALAMIPSELKERELVSLRASIRKGLAIIFESIFGAQKPEVLELLEQSRQEFQEIGKDGQVANVLQHIGGLYIELERYDEAGATLQEALRLARKASDEQLEGWILGNLSDLEMEQGDYAMALDLAERSRQKAVNVGDKEAEGDTWVNEAYISKRMSHLDKALIAAQKALDIFTENHNLRRTISARRALAAVLREMKRHDEVVEQLNQALRIANRLDLYRDQARINLALAKSELARRNLGLVMKHATDARRLADEQDMYDLVEQADELLRCCTNQE